MPKRRAAAELVAALVPALAAALVAALVLAGCAGGGPRRDEARSTAPTRPAAATTADGPGTDIPPDLAARPDAEPRIEAVRPGGANKPYQVLGRDYVPLTGDAAFRERGLASWYGRKFHGRRTASGEVYDMYAMTVAHPTLPIPSYARIVNPANGRAVVVRVNDRGPFHAGRIVDLSYAAALKLDLLRGVAPVELERLTFADIRAGAWRRDDAAATEPAVAFVAATPADAVADAPPKPAPTRAGRGFWVQLGAFRERNGAETFLRRVAADVDALAPLLATFGEAALFRVQAGPYPNRDEADAAARRIREALGLVPMIVERR